MRRRKMRSGYEKSRVDHDSTLAIFESTTSQPIQKNDSTVTQPEENLSRPRLDFLKTFMTPRFY